MSFLNPLSILVCLVAIALPVAVHLLSRRRVETVYLPTFRFLFEVRASSSRRFRWLQGMFIFVRVLIVLVVLLIISRPLVRDSENLLGATSGELVFFVDCSAGMDAVTRGESALDRAKKSLKRLIEQTPTDRVVSLVKVVDRPVTLVDRLPLGRSNLEHQIDSLSVGAGRANFYLALGSQRDDHPTTDGQYVVLTDLSRNGFREFGRAGSDDRPVLPALSDVQVLDVGSSEELNRVAVLGDQPVREYAPVGLPIPIQARLWNPSGVDVSATVRLVIDDTEVERRGLLLRAGQRLTETISVYVPSRPGTFRGLIEITPDDQADPFPADNQFRFALQVQPAMKVLIVNGNPSSEAHADEVAYLNTALRTNDSRDGKLMPSAFRVEVERETDLVALDATRLIGRFKEVGVLILANCGNVTRSSELLLAIREFVRDGGGLLVFPGDRVEPENYSTKFFQSSSPDPFLPVRLGRVQGDIDANSGQRLQFRDSASVLRLFELRKSPAARLFEQTKIRRWFPLEVGKSVPILADLSNQSPALVTAMHGRGKIICSAFPVNSNWSNLPLRGHEFVPLIFSLLSELQPRPNFEIPSSLRPPEPLTLSVRDPAALSGELISPSSRRTRLDFEWSKGAHEVRVEHLEEAGFYSALVRRERDQQPSWEGRFAVNLAEEESDFERISPKQLRSYFPEANVRVIDRTAEKVPTDSDRPREFWSIAVLLVLLLILAEFLLTTPRNAAPRGQGT